MNKYFICLANSYKHGNRCVAGIEIGVDKNGNLVVARHSDGRPRWIRPVTRKQSDNELWEKHNTPIDGAVPVNIATQIPILSIVKVHDVEPCPEKPHCEDVYYSKMECRWYKSDVVFDLLKQCVDSVHQNVFYSNGRALQKPLAEQLDYSLMLVHIDDAVAYIDKSREKSKNRLRFSYYRTEYEFPITDPELIKRLSVASDNKITLQDVYLTLSLGLEFEGFFFKLVAAVIDSSRIINHANKVNESIEELSYQEQQKQLYRNAYSKWTPENDNELMKSYREGVKIEELSKRFERNRNAITSRIKKLLTPQDTNWFEVYEEDLTRLIELKKEVEDMISDLRSDITAQMEARGETFVNSSRFKVEYIPSRTVMTFDAKEFRAKNEQLYLEYSRPSQRESTIVVRMKKSENS